MNSFNFCAILLIILLWSTSSAAPDAWKLVWADEFSGTNGTKPDPSKWSYDIGIGESGWGNNEMEFYTDSSKNSYLDGNSNLVIKAMKENIQVGPISRNYTSARLKTLKKFELTYGRFEARMKLPFGQGIWPAFWMLGNDIENPKVGWPRCGEIDIMEFIGREPTTIFGTIHGPGYSGSEGRSASITVQKLSEEFHIFAIEWEPTELRWYADGVLYHTETVATIAPNKWVFDHGFFILLNLAVGGYWPGYPDSSSVFPQYYVLDYVRVYKKVQI